MQAFEQEGEEVTTPLWSVQYGVNVSHYYESAGVHNRLRDAQVAYDKIQLGTPWKCKRIMRIGFSARKYTGADDVRVFKEEVLK